MVQVHTNQTSDDEEDLDLLASSDANLRLTLKSATLPHGVSSPSKTDFTPKVSSAGSQPKSGSSSSSSQKHPTSSRRDPGSESPNDSNSGSSFTEASHNSKLTEEFSSQIDAFLTKNVRIGLGHYRNLSILGLGNAADAAEVLAIGYILDALRESGDLSNFDEGLLASALFVGMLIGGLIMGFLGDRIGRRGVFIVAPLLYAFCSVCSAMTSDLHLITFFRMVGGVGIGGAIPCCFSLAVELSPPGWRGKTIVWIACNWVVGSLYAATVAWFFMGYLRFGWQCFACIVALPAFLAGVLGLLYLPESPYYLANHGRVDAALATLQTLYESNMPSALDDNADDDDDADSETKLISGSVSDAETDNQALEEGRGSTSRALQTSGQSSSTLARGRFSSVLKNQSLVDYLISSLNKVMDLVDHGSHATEGLEPIDHDSDKVSAVMSHRNVEAELRNLAQKWHALASQGGGIFAADATSIRSAWPEIRDRLGVLYSNEPVLLDTNPDSQKQSHNRSGSSLSAMEGSPARSITPLTGPSNLLVMLLLQSCWFTISLASDGIAVWIPSLYEEAGFSTSKYASVFIFSFSQLPAMLICFLLIDHPKYGRERLLFAGCGVAVASTFCFAFSHTSMLFCVVLSCLFELSVTVAFNALDALATESFPTHARATAFAVQSASGRLGAIAAQILFSALIEKSLTLLLLVCTFVLFVAALASRHLLNLHQQKLTSLEAIRAFMNLKRPARSSNH